MWVTRSLGGVGQGWPSTPRGAPFRASSSQTARVERLHLHYLANWSIARSRLGAYDGAELRAACSRSRLARGEWRLEVHAIGERFQHRVQSSLGYPGVWPWLAPQHSRPAARLDDVDASVERASAIGVEVEMPIQEMFWGERYGVVRDRWAIARHCRRRATRLTPDGIAGRAPPEV